MNRSQNVAAVKPTLSDNQNLIEQAMYRSREEFENIMSNSHNPIYRGMIKLVNVYQDLM